MHLHTTASDGSDTPEALIAKAKSIGLKTVSITDHDTLGGLLSVLDGGDDAIEIITGIEFSCNTSEKHGFDCHILGYGFDPYNEEIIRVIEHGRTMRFVKFEARVKYLEDNFGIILSEAEIQELRSYNAVAKPHIARILMSRGLADSVTDAIAKYLKGDDFPDDRIDAREAIDAIHLAGGIAVYAHPLGGELERRLTPCEFTARVKTLLEMGIDGLEAYYSRYSSSDRELVLGVARDMGLCVSAGSDYHGENKTVKLGELSSDGIEVSDLDVTALVKIRNRKVIV